MVFECECNCVCECDECECGCEEGMGTSRCSGGVSSGGVTANAERVSTSSHNETKEKTKGGWPK